MIIPVSENAARIYLHELEVPEAEARAKVAEALTSGRSSVQTVHGRVDLEAADAGGLRWTLTRPGPVTGTPPPRRASRLLRWLRSRTFLLCAGVAGAALIAAVLLVTLHGGRPAPEPASPPVPSSARATAADPVAILRAAGATVPAGTVYGDTDVYGDRMASGSFPGGGQVTVYTAASQAGYERLATSAPVGDTNGLVVLPGRLAVVELTGVFDAQANRASWGGPGPAQVAARVGGKAVTPGQPDIPGVP